jgi:hypothetical protein
VEAVVNAGNPQIFFIGFHQLSGDKLIALEDSVDLDVFIPHENYQMDCSPFETPQMDNMIIPLRPDKYTQ